MAIGTGNLPYQISTVSPFDIILAQTTNETIANINALATGTGLGDNSVTADKLAVNAVTGNDGWISTSDTWTYASASTFTVSGDKTGIYTKGTRLKWTQTTVRYGVVVNSSYSAPNTTVTIAVNTDFVIANATISDNFYSYSANPQGYPGKFNWTPVVTAPGGTTPTYSSVVGKFSLNGLQLSAQAVLSNTSGGTAGSGAAVVLLVSNPIIPSVTGVIGSAKSYESAGTGNTCIITDNNLSGTCYITKYDMNNIVANDQSSANRYLQLNFNYLI